MDRNFITHNTKFVFYCFINLFEDFELKIFFMNLKK